MLNYLVGRKCRQTKAKEHSAQKKRTAKVNDLVASDSARYDASVIVVSRSCR